MPVLHPLPTAAVAHLTVSAPGRPCAPSLVAHGHRSSEGAPRRSSGPARPQQVLGSRENLRRSGGQGDQTKGSINEAKLEVYSDLWDAIIIQDVSFGKLLAKVKRAYDGYIQKLKEEKSTPAGRQAALSRPHGRSSAGMQPDRDSMHKINTGESVSASRLEPRPLPNELEEVSLDDIAPVRRNPQLLGSLLLRNVLVHRIEQFSSASADLPRVADTTAEAGSPITTPPLFPDKVTASADLKRPEYVPRLNLNPRRAQDVHVMAVTCSTGSTIMDPTVEEPVASSYSDPFWEAASGRGKSVFKKARLAIMGQRSPHFNSSRQAAECVHGLVHSRSFPDLKSLSEGEGYPGFPGMTTSTTTWNDCFSIEKPLVNARQSWDQDGDDAARNAVYTSKRFPPTLPYIAPNANSEVTVDHKTGDRHVGLARSKLAVAPYCYAAIPWSRYAEHKNEILARHDPRLPSLKRSASSSSRMHGCHTREPRYWRRHSLARRPPALDAALRRSCRGLVSILSLRLPPQNVECKRGLYRHTSGSDRKMLVNFLFLSPKAEEEDSESEFSLSALSLSIALTVAPVLLLIAILLTTYSGIRNNFIKLGRRLDVALQGSGYTATVHTQRREKHSRAPEGIEQGCSSLGWLWIDFIPQGSTMLPPTTVIHVTAESIRILGALMPLNMQWLVYNQQDSRVPNGAVELCRGGEYAMRSYQTYPVLPGGMRVPVSLYRRTERISWPPVLAQYHARLEEAATNWYNFCRTYNGSWIWHSGPNVIFIPIASIILVQVMISFIWADSEYDDNFRSSRLMTLMMRIAMPIIFILAVWLGAASSFNRVQREFSSLESNLAVPLQGTGYVAYCYCIRKNRTNGVPEGLPRNCCQLGYMWIDFVPTGYLPSIGAQPSPIMHSGQQQPMQVVILLPPSSPAAPTLGNVVDSGTKKECLPQGCLYQCDYKDPSGEALSWKVVKIGDYPRPILNPNGVRGDKVVVALSLDDFEHEVGIGVSSSGNLDCSILLTAARAFLSVKFGGDFRKPEALAVKIFKKMISEWLARKVCHFETNPTVFVDSSVETVQWDVYLPGQYKGRIPKQFGKAEDLKEDAFAVFRTADGKIRDVAVPLTNATDLDSCHDVALKAFLRLRNIASKDDSQLELFLLRRGYELIDGDTLEEPKPKLWVHSLGRLAQDSTKVIECGSLAVSDKTMGWSIWPPQSRFPLKLNRLLLALYFARRFNRRSRSCVVFTVDETQYVVDLTAAVEEDKELHSSSEISTSSSSESCPNAMKRALASLYHAVDEAERSRIAPQDLWSDIVLHTRLKGMSEKTHMNSPKFEHYDLMAIGNASNIRNNHLGTGMPSVCYAPGFQVMWSVNPDECAEKRTSAFGKIESQIFMCFIYKDWYFPIQLGAYPTPRNCQSLFFLGLSYLSPDGFVSKMRDTFDISLPAPLEVEEYFDKLVALALKTPKKKRAQLYSTLLVEHKELNEHTEKSSLISATREAAGVPTCLVTDDFYRMEWRLVPRDLVNEDAVVFDGEDASKVLEFTITGLAPTIYIGVSLDKIDSLGPKGTFECTRGMEYAVKRLYGPEYLPDELSPTHLVGEFSRKHLIGLQVSTRIIPEDDKLEHVTFANLGNEVVQDAAAPGKSARNSRERIVHCKLKGTTALKWDIYGAGQYKGVFLPLPQGATTKADRKKQQVVEFVFENRKFPVPISNIFTTDDTPLCSTAFRQVFGVLYAGLEDIDIDITSPEDMVFDMERYLIALEEQKTKKKKKESPAPTTEFPVGRESVLLDQLGGGSSSACFLSQMDRYERKQRAIQRAAVEADALRHVVRRPANTRRTSIDSSKPTLESAVTSLIPLRIQSETVGGVWECKLSDDFSLIWPRDGITLQSRSDISRTVEGLVVSNGKVLMIFDLEAQDFPARKDDELRDTTCRGVLEKAIRTKYGQEASLADITVERFMNDLGPKSRKKDKKRDSDVLTPEAPRPQASPGSSSPSAKSSPAKRQKSSSSKPTADTVFPDVKALSLSMAADSAFEVSECRGKDDAGQAVVWRLWKKRTLYTAHEGGASPVSPVADFTAFYDGKPLMLSTVPNAEMTATILIDGAEYGFDLDAPQVRQVTSPEIDNPDSASQCAAILQVLVYRGSVPISYSLKQLKDDITLYNRAVAGAKEFKFMVRTPNVIATEAVLKNSSKNGFSCSHPLLNFRWKAYLSKYKGLTSVIKPRPGGGQWEKSKPLFKVPGPYISLVYTYKKGRTSKDVYFTVRAAGRPQDCREALQYGLEKLFESTNALQKEWISGAMESFSPIRIEERLKQLSGDFIAKKIKTIDNLGDPQLAVGQPIMNVATESYLVPSCFAMDDISKVTWSIMKPQDTRRPFANTAAGMREPVLVVIRTLDSDKSAPYGAYVERESVFTDDSVSCLNMIESFVTSAYVRGKGSMGEHADRISLLGLKGDIAQTIGQQNADVTSSLNEATLPLVHQSLQYLGEQADALRQNPLELKSGTKNRKSKEKIYAKTMVCKPDNTDFKWTVQYPVLPEEEGQAKKWRKKENPKSTYVEIAIGNKRSLSVLVSRTQHKDLSSCTTALEAAAAVLYPDLSTSAVSKNDIAYDISKYLEATDKVAKLKKKDRPSLQLSWRHGRAGTFRQKYEHQPLDSPAFGNFFPESDRYNVGGPGSSSEQVPPKKPPRLSLTNNSNQEQETTSGKVTPTPLPRKSLERKKVLLQRSASLPDLRLGVDASQSFNKDERRKSV
ncbi:hypothetical protein FOL47_011015 [Perkinsus chesapeaki]|uniref:Translin-associated factor X-interacting protein 1 N-terminal domain-containing protein n=1 Tax=Perkinsus chesapeaki TaxID=330153 RepID=A0A7J6MNE0_PERCH|nr:hypothetical protein FOL47_011015 [Perkinsus chesapeaki]